MYMFPPKKPLLETMQEDRSCLLLMVLGAAGLGVYHVGRAVQLWSVAVDHPNNDSALSH